MMPYVADVISEYDETKHYLIVCSNRNLSDDEYVVFDAGCGFTKYNPPGLLHSFGTCYLYRLTLPCRPNPYLYVLFASHEYSFSDLLGNAETDLTVNVDIELCNNLENLDRSILNSANELTYDVSEEGELKLRNTPEAEFISEYHDVWLEKQVKPFYYLNAVDECYLRVIYKNEMTEMRLIQQCHDHFHRARQQHTISDFMRELVDHFSRFFDSPTQSRSVCHVKLAYLTTLNSTTPRETFDLVGHIVLQVDNSEAELNKPLETHFISIDNVVGKERCDKVAYEVTFYGKYLTITVPGEEPETNVYQNCDFGYGFLLVQQHG